MGKKKRKKNNKKLNPIGVDSKSKILLIGNGLNLLSGKSKNINDIITNEWNKNYNDKIIGEINKRYLSGVPFPLQIVAATKDNVKSCMKILSEEFKSIDICEEQKKLIDMILNLKFDSILTTNYSLEFEKSTIANYSKEKVYKRYLRTKEGTERQRELGIFQCVELPDENNTYIWHIHGTALREKSMVMGQLYYGKLLSEVISRAMQVKKEYKPKKVFKPKSWIDYFLICDVHIMGFNLDFSEIDIWWLLNFKRIICPESKVFFYSKDISLDKKILFDCYDVELPKIDFDNNDNNYIEYYKKICEQI